MIEKRAVSKKIKNNRNKQYDDIGYNLFQYEIAVPFSIAVLGYPEVKRSQVRDPV